MVVSGKSKSNFTTVNGGYLVRLSENKVMLSWQQNTNPLQKRHFHYFGFDGFSSDFNEDF
jgi:hypothetical protein